jgi:uncharacterized protein YerC
MGMFDKQGGSKKCNCPHCRGGHSHNHLSDIEYNSGSDYDVTEEISAVDIEREDPQEIIDQYLEAILECENPEEVEEVLYEFFDDIFVHAMQETFITEIESKIMSLNLLKEGFVVEDEE